MFRVPPITSTPETLGRFARDDSGGATIWSLLWLMGFAIMAGVAIDSTNGHRHKTMLQATVDVSALAGAISLPNLELEADYAAGGYSDIRAKAVAYADKNLSMASSEYGNYVDASDTEAGDVQVGHWDFQNRTFSQGAEPVNAVQVEHYLYQDERGNGVPTSILHVIGLSSWDVAATAVAVKGINSCLLNGIISREELKMRANKSTVAGDVCLHGQLAVTVQPNGTWENPESLTGGKNRPELAQGNWNIGNGQQDTEGNDITAQMQDPNDQVDLYPPLVDQIVPIGYSMLAGVPGYRQFLNPQPADLNAMDGSPFVRVLPNGISEIAGPPVQGAWWRIDEGIQLASLDGFSSVASLLGLSAKGGNSGNSGGGSSGGGSSGGGTATITYSSTQQWESGMSAQNPDWTVTSGPIDINASFQVTYGSVVAGEMTETTQTVSITQDEDYVSNVTGKAATLEEGYVYFIDSCQSNKLDLTGHIKNVTIVTNCQIDIAGDALIQNVVMLSTDEGTHSINVSNGAQIGSTCDKWGGVIMMGNGDVRVVNADEAKFFSTQIVARDQIHFSAQADMSGGISMLAGGPIDIMPDAQIGAISSTVVESGCPQDGVIFQFDEFPQGVRLVH